MALNDIITMKDRARSLIIRIKRSTLGMCSFAEVAFISALRGRS